MRYLSTLSLALVVLMALACTAGESEEEVFISEMREWFATNIGDDIWSSDYERMSPDEILELIEEIEAIKLIAGYEFSYYTLVGNLESVELANVSVLLTSGTLQLAWEERAKSEGESYVDIPGCGSGGPGQGPGLTYKYWGDSELELGFVIACWHQEEAILKLRRTVRHWEKDIFGCYGLCYGGSQRD